MEQIYTIPINEAFEKGMEEGNCDCPMCKLYDKLEKKEVEMTLGPSMMEPATRIETNEKGFCHAHYRMLMAKNNSLSLALILESHLTEQKGKLDGNALSRIFGGLSNSHLKATKALRGTCYICEALESNFRRVIDNTVMLYDSDPKFREKLLHQKYFCLPHYQELLEYAKSALNKRKYADFFDDISSVEKDYFEKIIKDVSWYCKKFDYRYENEPWYDSKDAVERAIRFLSSGIAPDKK